MLRLIHSQTVVGPIRVPDIDDGLPNKTAHRMIGDPKKYQRDGYANEPKQPCYIPYANPADSTQPGYINLQETNRVTASAANGAIAKLAAAGLISVVSVAQAGLLAPTLSVRSLASSGILTLTGTNLLSTLPDVSSIIITGAGAVTLTRAQIITGSGTFTDTSVVIPAALVPGIDAQSLVAAKADSQTTSAVGLTAPTATIVSAVLSTDLTITGTYFLSLSPQVTSVVITGTGAVTLTQSQITTGGGTISDTSIFIPAALIPSVATSTSSVKVNAHAVDSNVVAVS